MLYWIKRSHQFTPITTSDIQSGKLPEELQQLKETAEKAVGPTNHNKAAEASKAAKGKNASSSSQDEDIDALVHDLVQRAVKLALVNAGEEEPDPVEPVEEEEEEQPAAVEEEEAGADVVAVEPQEAAASTDSDDDGIPVPAAVQAPLNDNESSESGGEEGGVVAAAVAVARGDSLNASSEEDVDTFHDIEDDGAELQG